MALAVRAVSRDEARRSVYYLLATMVLGALFCGIHSWEYYKHFKEHLIPGLGFYFPGPYPEQVKLFYFLYYVMTGLHLLHVFIGIAVLGVISVLTRRGKFSDHYHIPVEISGLYWHFVDVVWVFLFPLFYLVSGS